MFSEDEIRTILFKKFSGSNNLVLTKWRGWTIYGTGGKGESVFLRMEFDIARFERRVRQYLSPEITLTGYEVKGVTRTKEGESRFPSFAEGVSQALALLFQGADYSYLVWPEPDDDTRSALKTLLDRYCPIVGLIFVMKTENLWEYRKATKNSYTSDETKKRMLSALLSGGHYSDSYVPDWARRHEF